MVCYARKSNLLKPSGGISGASLPCIATPAGFLFGIDIMKKIPLTRGLFALVDDCDYESISQYKWYALNSQWGFRAARSCHIDGKKRCVLMGRQILGLVHGDRLQADHANHNTLDDRRCNLRTCTNQQNSYNRKRYKNSSSKYKGVSWYGAYAKWMGYIRSSGKNVFLGYFGKEDDAARAYNSAARRLHGQYAYLNKIKGDS